ncbi:hypothetical protein [Mariniplasma anaerobium]|uniref:Uncharacterized protein n=1 Tax=Mariniplasma anaerobium TaxID=2735436 RepID=A0A7U9TKF2_9MOLU|nr:hypothetical protein [Mariniplasma anaerobium]BCR36597.1 hypothetical protein MPAN_014900 [Mariniplasma anaerobium]
MSFEYSEYYNGFVGRPLLVVGIAVIVLLVSLILFVLYDQITSIYYIIS